MTYDSRNTLIPWPPLLAQQLNQWQSLTTITAAEVVLEHQRGNTRAFRVKVRLDGLGPALCTEVCDSTLEGALLLVTQDLAHQIDARQPEPLGSEKTPRPRRATGKRKTRCRPGAESRPPAED